MGSSPGPIQDSPQTLGKPCNTCNVPCDFARKIAGLSTVEINYNTLRCYVTHIFPRMRSFLSKTMQIQYGQKHRYHYFKARLAVSTRLVARTCRSRAPWNYFPGSESTAAGQWQSIRQPNTKGQKHYQHPAPEHFDLMTYASELENWMRMLADASGTRRLVL